MSAASRTLADVDRQIAGRSGPADSAVSTDADDDPSAVSWADLDDGFVTRLAAAQVIATNRALSQHSLRNFLR